MKKPLVVLCLILTVSLLPRVTDADEGMWPMFDLEQLDFDNLRSMGLELDAQQLYGADGSGLWKAIVQVGGGSGGFVSPEGLIVTNHHVAFGAIQSQSTSEVNYIEEGFLAQTRADEIPAIGYNCYVGESFEDVTKDVMKVVKTGMSDLERYKAIDKRTKKIIAKAEKGKDVKCRVSAFDGGRRYILVTYFKIRDIRIVAVPSKGVGNYGGETDNWMWPRHTGDFSFLRAYVAPDGKSAEYAGENVPYNSSTFMPVSAGALTEGDFALTLGYPGGTDRFESSFAIDEAVGFYYPNSIRQRQDLIQLMEEASVENEEWSVRLSSRIAGLSNYLKNYEGMLLGLARGKVADRRRAREEQLTGALGRNPQLNKKYGGALEALRARYREHSTFRDKDMVLGWMGYMSRYLGFANRVYKMSIERKKKDMDRERGYMERDLPAAKRRLREAQINLVPEVDQRLLVYMLRQAMALPPNQRIEALDAMIGDVTETGMEVAIQSLASRLYAGTKVGTVENRMAMFEMSTDELLALDDSFVKLAVALYPEREELRVRGKEFSGALKELNPKLISAYRELGIGPKYPDANGTMRLTYGRVMGYSPADATSYACFTTLTGVIEKETGDAPFNSPPALLKAYHDGNLAPYIDTNLGDVPVDFLTDHDTTGGSSGSPVVNGHGALIGLCFDGNYEAIAADYQFEPRLTRTINVDSRYILFILDKVMGASNLLDEMTIL